MSEFIKLVDSLFFAEMKNPGEDLSISLLFNVSLMNLRGVIGLGFGNGKL